MTQVLIKRRMTVAAEAEQWTTGHEATVAALAQKALRYSNPDETVSFEVHDDTNPPAGLYLFDAAGLLLFRIEQDSWLVFDPTQNPSLFQLTADDFAATYEGV